MIAWVAATAAAFNLVCAATETSGKILDFANQAKREVTIEFRVDLDRKRWCSCECLSTSPIFKVTDTHIIFRQEEDKDGDIGLFVSRETGDLFDRNRSFLINWVTLRQGKCERAPFKGFPALKF